MDTFRTLLEMKFLWILSILIMMQSLGIRLNVILASSAALLVGVGLGLQHTFNNFVSGIILLFEGSIKVGDVLELDGEVVENIKSELREIIYRRFRENGIQIPFPQVDVHFKSDETGILKQK